MTAPGSPRIPGLASIQEAAARHGIDISDAVFQAEQMVMTNPPEVQHGSDRLAAVASGLDVSRLDVQQAGTGVQTSGWSGEAANAFVPHHAGLVEGMTAATAAAGQLAGLLGELARTFAGAHHTVLTLTATTGAALDMLRVQ